MASSVIKDVDNLTRDNIDQAVELLYRLLFWTHEKQTEREGKFKTDDVRGSTFGKFTKRLSHGYINFKRIEFYFNDSDQLADEFKISKNDDHSLNQIVIGYFICSRFDLFIGIFSLFEDALKIICKAILPPEEYESLFFNVAKILENQDIAKLIKDNYPKQFDEIKNKDKLIPLIRIINKFIALKIMTKDEGNFCEFYACIRNTIHNNGFYFGKPRDFTILGKKYKFEDGKPILYSLLDEIAFIKEILRIFEEFTLRINHDHIKDNAYVAGGQ